MLYSVTYLSIYDEPFLETEVFKTREEADQKMLEYVSDICETEGWTLEEVEFEVGDTHFSEVSRGHHYCVKMTEHKID